VVTEIQLVLEVAAEALEVYVQALVHQEVALLPLLHFQSPLEQIIL
jgi:hypothetical protein